jgi:glycosyltransferase involved in cell wall biosynthesis
MKIVFVSSEYPTENIPIGGIGSFLYNYCNSLVKMGFNVIVIGVFSISKTTISNENGVIVYRLKNNNIKFINAIYNYIRINIILKKINSKEKIDIIETPELGLAFLLKNKNSTYVIRLHGGHHFLNQTAKLNWKRVFQEKFSFSKADAFIVISEYVKNETEKHLSFHNKPIAQIYNPINFENFNLIEESAGFNFKIVFVGTVYEKKGIRQLIQSFGILKSQIPDASLEIYGKDWYDISGFSYIETLKNHEISKLGDFGKDIHFHGAIPYSDISKIYSEASVCVFPSLIEAQGLVVMEAMAMQKVVIFTKYGVGPEIINHLENGLLCDPKSPNDIAEKIIWVYKNKMEVDQIAVCARQSVIEKFDLKKIVNQNIEFYKSLLNKY